MALISTEVFVTGPGDPDRLWALVSDIGRLPEWTDAQLVERLDELPLTEGQRFVTSDGARKLTWGVVTLADQVLEVTTQLADTRLGIGVRVTPDPLGVRLVLAGAFDPERSAWRARLFGLPALRRRFDRWAPAALRAA